MNKKRRVEFWWSWRNLMLGVGWSRTEIGICIGFLTISIWRGEL